MNAAMRIFLAGATGAIGRRLIPQLVSAGHTVIAATRSPGKAHELMQQGAEPAIVDVLDKDAIHKVVVSARPDVVIHELTALANVMSYRNFDSALAETNRLRTEGLDNLIAAAHASGATRFIAQSYAGWPTGGGGERVKSETAPLDPAPLKSMVKSLDAIRHIETTVPAIAGLNGIVLRYGHLYGAGTGFSETGAMVKLVKRRAFPIIGGGHGIWSFLHIDDAASATQVALTRGGAGIYNIVDDDPSEVCEWLPALAKAAGAPPPYSIPKWLGIIVAGKSVVFQMTSIRGLSNDKARRTLLWEPRQTTWREGFKREFHVSSQTVG